QALPARARKEVQRGGGRRLTAASDETNSSQTRRAAPLVRGAFDGQARTRRRGREVSRQAGARQAPALRPHTLQARRGDRGARAPARRLQPLWRLLRDTFQVPLPQEARRRHDLLRHIRRPPLAVPPLPPRPPRPAGGARHLQLLLHREADQAGKSELTVFSFEFLVFRKATRTSSAPPTGN